MANQQTQLCTYTASACIWVHTATDTVLTYSACSKYLQQEITQAPHENKINTHLTTTTNADSTMLHCNDIPVQSLSEKLLSLGAQLPIKLPLDYLRNLWHTKPMQMIRLNSSSNSCIIMTMTTKRPVKLTIWLHIQLYLPKSHHFNFTCIEVLGVAILILHNFKQQLEIYVREKRILCRNAHDSNVKVGGKTRRTVFTHFWLPHPYTKS